MTLADFLLARIAEDETAANRTLTDRVMPWGDQDWAEIDEPAHSHVWRWDPHRVLAECDAKRHVVELHIGARATESAGDSVTGVDDLVAMTAAAATDKVLRHLASVYADHPDYREEWKP